MSIAPAGARPMTQFVSQAGWMLWTGLSLKDVFKVYVKGEALPNSRICSTRSHYPLLSLVSCVIHTLEWTLLETPELVVVANLVTGGLYAQGALDTASFYHENSDLRAATYFAFLSNICMVAYSVLKIGAFIAGEAIPLIVLGVPVVTAMVSTKLSMTFERNYTGTLASTLAPS